MKVKTFEFDDVIMKYIENKVNEFIKDKNVIDIKYQSFTCYNIHSEPIVEDRIIILYED